jgi:membrane protein involved in colicin uptake
MSRLQYLLVAACGAASLSFAAHAADYGTSPGTAMSRDDAHAMKKKADADYDAAKDKASADYKAAKAKCETMKGDAEDACEAQAKADEKKAKADAKATHEKLEAEIDAKRHCPESGSLPDAVGARAGAQRCTRTGLVCGLGGASPISRSVK